MKTLLSAFLIMSMLAALGYCECAYFRTAATLLKCGAADIKTLKANDPYPAPSDELALDDVATPTLVQVTCSCDYSLMGSVPRCDLDQSSDRTAVLAADSPATPCRRGTSMCRDVCPPRLP